MKTDANFGSRTSPKWLSIFPPIPPWVFIWPGAGVLGDVDLDGISVHRFSFAVHAFLVISLY